VDDLFMTGDDMFTQKVVRGLKKAFKVGSEYINDLIFCGQHVKKVGDKVIVDQDRQIEELSEASIPKQLNVDTKCTSEQHTSFRSLLGSLNWLQSQTQFHVAYKFSRVASASAGPTIGDMRVLNKIVRSVRMDPQRLYFHKLKGQLRSVGYPDASYRNNADLSSQRAQVIFISERRNSADAVPAAEGTLADAAHAAVKTGSSRASVKTTSTPSAPSLILRAR
jgi:hypothetical protein